MNKTLNPKINQQNINQLIRLQELFHSHFMTQELVSEMIALYVKLGESLNEKKHPIKVYFMEKIKYVLSRPEINSILEKESIMVDRSSSTSTNNSQPNLSDQEMEIKQLAEEAKEQVRQNHLINLNKDRQYEQTIFGETLKNKERNLKIEMQMKIKEQVGNLQKISTDIQKAHQKSVKQSQQIQKLFNKQDQSLFKRLAGRKKDLIRKNTDDLLQQKNTMVEQEQPIAKEQLISDQSQINRRYSRFRRLTVQTFSPVKRGNKAMDNLNKNEVDIKQKEQSSKTTIFI